MEGQPLIDVELKPGEPGIFRFTREVTANVGFRGIRMTLYRCCYTRGRCEEKQAIAMHEDLRNNPGCKGAFAALAVGLARHVQPA